MHQPQRVSRRQFLKLSTLAALGTMAVACQPATPQPEPTTVAAPTTAPASTSAAAPTKAPAAATAVPTVAVSAFKEAPQLAEMVKAGKLPPVEKRLPENPMVVTPVEMVGVYGGSWKNFIDSVNRISDISDFSEVGLLKWNYEQSGSIPCLAESWTAAPDGTEFTIKLRKGMKWSDGEPFTADDIIFWWKDIIGNDELTPVKPYWMYTASRKLGVIEKVDDNTIKVKFPEPHGLFILYLTKEFHVLEPKHYLSQYHITYTPKADLEKKAAEMKLATWIDLFKNRQGFNVFGTSNPEAPGMNPWQNTTPSPSERFVFERNAYFPIVDTEGNQLPYIDQVDVRVVTPEVINMRIIAGEPNFQATRQQAFADLPLYLQYADQNEYDIYEWGDLQISECGIWINQTCPDPVDRELFRDKRFRIALSVAIDRERINQTLYSGMGKATAATLPPVESNIYKEEYATAYTQYDVEMANKLLDEIGLDKKDAEGYRLKSDGKRAAFVIEPPSPRLGMIDNLKMIVDDYKKIGIEFIVKPIAESLWSQRTAAGEMQMVGWPMGKASNDTGLVPINTGTHWGPLWGLWYNSGGKQGEEPVPDVKQLMDYWSDILKTVDDTARFKLYDQILQSQAENVWVIGVVGPVPKPIIKKKWFRNVKKDGTWSFHHGHFIGWTNTFQFFIEKDKQQV